MSTELGAWDYEHNAPIPIDVHAANLTSALGVAGAERQPATPALQGAG
jgi:hypothetical protein